jgi:hypothetical protein
LARTVVSEVDLRENSRRFNRRAAVPASDPTESSAASSERRSFIAPAALFAIFLAAYATTIHRPLRGDSVWFAHDVMMPRENFFHPHHLLHLPFMRILFLPFVPLLTGPEERLLYLRWVCTALSALVPASFCLAAMRLGAGMLWASGVALTFGFLAAVFNISSQVEVYSLTMLALCLAMLGLALPDRSPAGRSLAVGGWTAAMLFHQTALFFAPVILASEAARHRLHGGRLAARLAVAIGLPLCLVALAYAAVAWHLGIVVPDAFSKWLTTHAHQGYWGKGDLSAGTLVAVRENLKRAIVVSLFRTTLWRAAVLGCLGLYFSLLVSRGPGALRRPAVAAGCLIWMAILAGFTIWWDVRGSEFWGMILLPGCFVLSLAAPGPRPATRSWEGTKRTIAAACLAASVVLLGVADLAMVRGGGESEEVTQTARAVARVAHDGDLVLAADTGGSTYYRIYLYNRGVRVLAMDVKPASEAAARAPGAAFTGAPLDWLEAEVRSQEAAGARLWVDRKLLEGRVSTERLLHDLDVEAFKAGLKDRFEAIPANGDPRPWIYELRATRPAP